MLFDQKFNLESNLYLCFNCGSSSVGRASAFQAECRRFEPGLPLNSLSRCSSGVERFLGKEKVPSSTLGIGSTDIKAHFLAPHTVSKKR